MEDKIKNIIITIVFSLFITTFFIINLVKEDTLVSTSERRKLKQLPNFTIQSLFNGSFFKDFDSYTTDQFIYRDEFRSLKVNLELNLKGNYNNLYTYNDYIINQLYPLNTNSILRLTSKINFINNNYLNNSNHIYFSIIPDKNYFVSNGNLKLDYNKMEDMLLKELEYAEYIDIMDQLSLDNYYKTDTHWKEETLKDIALTFSNKMNFNISNKYKEKEITKFLGVYAGQIPINSTEENIKILTNNVISSSTVYNYETNLTTEVYDLSKINSIDKYDIYLSGAASLITITNNNSLNDRELIVFRDSYGSSLIPLFIEGYNKITVVDIRYISSRILDRYIDFKNKDILFIYSTLLINDSFSLK